jgi:hypothetical protein
MDNGSRVRWAILSCALVATIAAIFVDPGTIQRAGSYHARLAHGNASPVPAHAMETVFADEADADPFAPQGWQEPPPPAPVVPVKQAAVPVASVDTAPPAPPPLPFRYVGRFSDDAGGVIYLARGDQTVLAHMGDVLDGAYRVLAVESTRIDFEYLPTGTKQPLDIPASQ